MFEPCGLSQGCQRIARAAPAFWILDKDAALDKRLNITMGGVLRALRQLGVFRACKLAFEPVQQAIDHGALPPVDWLVLDAIPETRFVQNCL